MNRKTFYEVARRSDNGIFGTGLSQDQVDGTEAVLDEALREGADLGQAAYILATAYGETGGRMKPVRENMNYSAGRLVEVFSASRRQGISPNTLAGNPVLLANTVYGGDWGRKNLGNTDPNDGWNFRGAFVGQITGRHNFTKWSESLAVDLIGDPTLIDDVKISAAALVKPMLEGWATGIRLSAFVDGEKRDYVNARQTWNGTFEASKYAAYAEAFEEALQISDYAATEAYEAPPEKPAGGGPMQEALALVQTINDCTSRLHSLLEEIKCSE